VTQVDDERLENGSLTNEGRTAKRTIQLVASPPL
jgi:hypothetical protein